MTRGRIFLGVVLSAVLALPLGAQAKGGHAPLPSADGKRPGLTMKVLRYTGGTNGKMVVEVRNPTARTVAFEPQGLYFVPEGDPDKAPQRLGAAGPFEVAEGGTWKPQQQYRVAPGKTVQVQLQVFCIDSHRSSPSASHQFNMAVKRLPKELRQKIVTGAADELRKNGYRMPAAKSAIQSHIWRTRDSKWIRLEGERKREKEVSPQKNDRRHPIRMRHPNRPSLQQQRIGID